MEFVQSIMLSWNGLKLQRIANLLKHRALNVGCWGCHRLQLRYWMSGIFSEYQVSEDHRYTAQNIFFYKSIRKSYKITRNIFRIYLPLVCIKPVNVCSLIDNRLAHSDFSQFWPKLLEYLIGRCIRLDLICCWCLVKNDMWRLFAMLCKAWKPIYQPY